jgi:hypothetical protein
MYSLRSSVKEFVLLIIKLEKCGIFLFQRASFVFKKGHTQSFVKTSDSPPDKCHYGPSVPVHKTFCFAE